MLTASQIAAIIMLLNAFGVPASVVSQVQIDITPPATTTQATVNQSTTQDTSQTTDENTSTSTDESTGVPQPPPFVQSSCTISIVPNMAPPFYLESWSWTPSNAIAWVSVSGNPAFKGNPPVEYSRSSGSQDFEVYASTTVTMNIQADVGSGDNIATSTCSASI